MYQGARLQYHYIHFALMHFPLHRLVLLLILSTCLFVRVLVTPNGGQSIWRAVTYPQHALRANSKRRLPQIPEELIVLILNDVPESDLTQAALVCRRFWRLAIPILWRYLPEVDSNSHIASILPGGLVLLTANGLYQVRHSRESSFEYGVDERPCSDCYSLCRLGTICLDQASHPRRARAIPYPRVLNLHQHRSNSRRSSFARNEQGTSESPKTLHQCIPDAGGRKRIATSHEL